MLRFILYTLGFYFLFRFITGFLIPVVRTTLQLRMGFKAMQEQQEAAAAATNTAPKRPEKPDDGDYLDFEEVK
jgi:hypothetical protein